MAEQVATFPERYGRVLHLFVVHMGENPASVRSFRNKSKTCEAVGIKNTTILEDESISKEELLTFIKELNANESVAPEVVATTPVPGGVGLMTITYLMENTIEFY